MEVALPIETSFDSSFLGSFIVVVVDDDNNVWMLLVVLVVVVVERRGGDEMGVNRFENNQKFC